MCCTLAVPGDTCCVASPVSTVFTIIFASCAAIVPSSQRIWADSIYARAGLAEWMRESFQIVLEIVKRNAEQKGFAVLPRRLVVERTFAWLGRYRRLSKDYEHCTLSSECSIYLAPICTIVRRVATAT